MRSSFVTLVAVCALSGCGAVKPPASQLPSADAALAQLREQQACAQSLHTAANVDNWSPDGRIRSKVLFYAAGPASLRLDAAAFGMNALTLSSDGREFRLSDFRANQFLVGPATACNLARVTQVPLPGDVLVGLLRGKAPVLKHGPGTGAATLRWDARGHYLLSLTGANQSAESIRLAVHPDDMHKPWNAQRLRVLGATVFQQGIALYDAELSEHAPAAMGTPRIDSEGVDEPLPVSGPLCRAELPRVLRLKVPEADQDVLFRFSEPEWNAPLPIGVFTHEPAAGLSVYRVDCSDLH